MMTYPEFYNEVKSIKMYDPLSEFLGSFDKGIITFKYQHIVETAGHSCPTVAGAYLMTAKALETLYGGDIPVRGEVKVEFKENIEEGVAGVIANVITNITGATEVSGFKGINGKYARHSLMAFGQDINSSARFTRIDNGKSVDIFYNPASVPADSKMMPLMQKAIMDKASNEEKAEFGKLWQKRVESILLENYNNSEVIRVVEI